MKIQLVPHLTFNGECKEALDFYVGIFAGKVEELIYFGKANAGELQRVMYACLVFGRNKIAFCDQCPGEAVIAGSNVLMDVTFQQECEAGQVFNALAEQGTIIVPFGKTEWSENYGLVKDKFDILWNIMH